jgi:hypothetical protein
MISRSVGIVRSRTKATQFSFNIISNNCISDLSDGKTQVM